MSNLPSPYSSPYVHLERISLVAPLGLRFADTVTGRLRLPDLTVVAAPKNKPWQTVKAIMNPSGIYGFTHLPGLRELEHGAGDESYWDALTDAQRQPFTITVMDNRGRFYPFVADVNAPQRNIYHYHCAGATITSNTLAGAIPLFSTPSRPVSSGMGVIRMEVLDGTNVRKWAVVEARRGDSVLGHSVADHQGQVALVFPYPPPDSLLPTAPPRVLKDQSWDIVLRTYHSPVLNDVDLPDLCDILQQPQVGGEQTVTLRFGRELIVK